MYWSFSDDVWFYVVPALSTLALLIYAWPRRSRPIVPYFIAVVLIVLIWTILACLERLSAVFEVREHLVNALYFPISFSSVTWLFFGLAYSERHSLLSTKFIIMMLVIPTITTILAMTNPLHGIVFGEAMIDDSGTFSVLVRPRHGWFWIHTVYSYMTTIMGSLYVVIYVIHQKEIYRKQGFLMAMGAILPLFANAGFLAFREKLEGIDPTSIAVTVAVILFAWGIFKFKLLDLVPMARARIVDSMRDLIVVLDNRGRIMDLNPAIINEFAFFRQPCVGEKIQEVVPEDFDSLIKLGTLPTEISYRQYGEDRTYRAYADPILDRHGNEMGRILVLFNITPMKEKEQALMDARNKAETATQAKSEFLATMSHEIRTPMNGILGFAALLGESELTAEQQNFVSTIQKSGRSLLTLINDILDFAKIEAGKVKIDLQPFVLHDSIEEALESIAEAAARADIDLAYTIDPNVPEAIITDPVRLNQIFINLLGNAIKFTESGHIEVVVGCEEIPADPKTPYVLQFSVSDSGIGIPDDQLDNIFDTFSQVDTSTTRSNSGTGLGLAICKNLCKLMGGKMWVESELSVGSSFHFTLPVMEHRKAVEEEPSGTTLNGHTLLIAGSREKTRNMLSTRAVSWGMQVRTAHSIEEVATLPLDSVDVAMLDLGHETNLQLANELRKKRPGLPIIGVRSVSEAAGEESGGIFHWLARPVKQVDLHKALHAALKIVQPAEKAADSAFDQTLGKKHPLRILVAEDNEVNQELITLFFQHLGYEIDMVDTGLKAAKAALTRPYDVIFMDIYMPEMDGLQATLAIRKRFGSRPRPRIIAMTASVTKSDRIRCQKVGMDGFISKPIEVHRLTKLLKALKPVKVVPVIQKKTAPMENGAVSE